MDNTITPKEIVDFCKLKGVDVSIQEALKWLHTHDKSVEVLLVIIKEEMDIRNLLKSFKDAGKD
jgi:hypothetical protein